MMWRKEVFFLVLFCVPVIVKSGISVDGVTCGQIKCPKGQYCNHHSACSSCADVCDPKNPEIQICEEQCQDFLHNQRYVQKGQIGDEAELKATVIRLSHMVTVTLSLVCFMLVVLAGIFCFQLYRWKVKKQITLGMLWNKFLRRSPDQNETSTPTPKSRDDRKHDLRLDMPSPTVNSDHSPVTVSTSISRRPAEDSTLDYAYDNPAMTR